MRILLSGGGTAGHIYPALTVAALLVAEGHEVHFVGTPDGLEAKLAEEAGIAFHGLRARGFDRSHPLSLVTSAAVIAASTLRAASLLRGLSADVVLGFGGYVSLPVGLAAAAKGVPLVLHEQNSVPGLANRVLSRWARAVGVTYEGSIYHLARPERAVLTGNPVRPEVLSADRARGRAALGIDADAVVLLVFGGSRGARHINDAFVSLAPTLMGIPSLQVVHSAGRIEAASVAERVTSALGGDGARYRVVDYIDAMGDAIAAADVVVARAGATSIAEITAVGRAAVLVPYPYATDDHQTLNARAVAQSGGAEVVCDAELDTERFRDSVMRVVADPGRQRDMAAASAALGRRDAAQRVAALVTESGSKGEESR
ncbi:MAG: undecaprenyldiphospho-muramoylpentapeptide beta-N-acetylglucosaminyltransferase [Coriobacteriia bacterium]|nr:undecaprenyldiphospho-muramoylpentapeptide beta-N-acetylglucosaminyltransferase [Coriobacteriia bacterium]